MTVRCTSVYRQNPAYRPAISVCWLARVRCGQEEILLTRFAKSTVFPCIVFVLASSCAGGAAVNSSPIPAPSSPAALPAGAEARRVSLPLRVMGATWRVSSVARVKVTGGGVSGAAAEEQRIESRGLVSWTVERTSAGAIRASGQVDSFTVRTSFDAGKGAMLPTMPGLLLLDATLDSATVRVTTKPPLANECDRPEAGASAMARELLVRIPNGILVGERWRDSSVTLICRSGVPMTVHTTVTSTVESVDEVVVVVRREMVSRFEGKSGSPFRSLELSGTSTGAQRVEIGAQRGAVERLEGTSTLTLQATERLSGAVPRVQQVTQRVEIRAERR